MVYGKLLETWFAERHPFEVDGDQDEVRATICADLEGIAKFVEQYCEAAAKQLRGAGVTEAMEVEGKLAEVFMAKDYGAAYERRRPKEARLVEQLPARGEQLARYIRVLVKAAREYDENPGPVL